MPWDVFLLTMIGTNGFVAAVSLAGVVSLHVVRALYWFLKQFFNLEPLERWTILINGFAPIVLTGLCCTLATAGGYVAWTPNVAFGAFQIGLVVGFGPYIGISLGKAAVKGTKKIVSRPKQDQSGEAAPAPPVTPEAQFHGERGLKNV
jgi:hypothetical protein